MEREKAGFWIRFFAYLFDKIILKLLSLFFLLLSILVIVLKNRLSYSGLSVAESLLENIGVIIIFIWIFSALINMAYFTYFTGVRGQTVGKKIMGIKVYTRQGEKISYPEAFWRYFFYSVSALFLAMGFFWIVVDKDKQAWHDKLAGTYVGRE